MINPSVVVPYSFKDENGLKGDAVIFLSDDHSVTIRPLDAKLQSFTIGLNDFLQIAESLKQVATARGAKLQ
jgi:hypothetical protein